MKKSIFPLVLKTIWTIKERGIKQGCPFCATICRVPDKPNPSTNDIELEAKLYQYKDMPLNANTLNKNIN